MMLSKGFQKITYKTHNPDVIGNCWFKIYNLDGSKAVVLSEEDSTKGSITNFFEALATDIQKKYLPNDDPKKIVWFEHWGPSRSMAKPRATFKHVKLNWDEEYSNPEWTEYRKGNLNPSSNHIEQLASKIIDELPM